MNNPADFPSVNHEMAVACPTCAGDGELCSKCASPTGACGCIDFGSVPAWAVDCPDCAGCKCSPQDVHDYGPCCQCCGSLTVEREDDCAGAQHAKV